MALQVLSIHMAELSIAEYLNLKLVQAYISDVYLFRRFVAVFFKVFTRPTSTLFCFLKCSTPVMIPIFARAALIP